MEETEREYELQKIEKILKYLWWREVEPPPRGDILNTSQPVQSGHQLRSQVEAWAAEGKTAVRQQNGRAEATSLRTLKD